MSTTCPAARITSADRFQRRRLFTEEGTQTSRSKFPETSQIQVDDAGRTFYPQFSLRSEEKSKEEISLSHIDRARHEQLLSRQAIKGTQKVAAILFFATGHRGGPDCPS
ncbi:hypothetical protein [Schlesneria sp. DSM 10557]|uniref:hypothetical protein n=1 Tax=Schlesneria sp. DSM 10557 TaxID=3044399 RepID=UPI00359F22E5